MSSHSPFCGSFVALPTFFTQGRIDLEQLYKLIDSHIAADSDGLLVCGTTAESVTLSDYERRMIMCSAVEYTAGRVPVIVGVGSIEAVDCPG